jgi:type I restriction enzyme S subunit|tara:strand:- start:12 stop:272 length:261 start_codon:yes stop_codon:yes gene_type:complete
LNGSIGQRFISESIIGTSQPKLALFRLKNLIIPIPPIIEQQKIASILISVDKAILKTDDIIVKTQQLKMGLMQVLLTGKKRVKTII